MVNFVDRVPTHPGRVRLTPVAGQTNVYDLTREDDPSVVGTPVNAALFTALQNDQNEVGTYVGTGNGSAVTRTITFSFVPKAFIIIGNGYIAIWVEGSDSFFSVGSSPNSRPLTWSGSSVSWSGTGSDGYDSYMNTTGKDYFWIAIR